MLNTAKSPDTGSARLAEVAITRGFLTREQVQATLQRQRELASGGIRFSFAQTLLERHFLTLQQFKQLMKESGCYTALLSKKPQIERARFGRYELLEVLSEQGVCRVVKATDTHMCRKVVLKIYPKALLNDRQGYERFKREIVMAGKLSHPNIVAAFGTDEFSGSPFIVFEFVDGKSLQHRLEREGNLPEMVAWQIGREIAKGLAYAAELGILHRDIKPDNILCGKDGSIRILDIGCGKLLSQSAQLTVPGTTIGTPFYMSPEQALGIELNDRTDVYSLGCTIYHLLTGSVPFFSTQCFDVMQKHVNAQRPDPRELLPEISAESAKLVMQLMSIRRDMRPSAAALVKQIDSLLERLPEAENVVRPVLGVLPSAVKVDAELPAGPVDAPREVQGWAESFWRLCEVIVRRFSA